MALAAVRHIGLFPRMRGKNVSVELGMVLISSVSRLASPIVRVSPILPSQKYFSGFP